MTANSDIEDQTPHVKHRGRQKINLENEKEVLDKINSLLDQKADRAARRKLKQDLKAQLQGRDRKDIHRRAKALFMRYRPMLIELREQSSYSFKDIAATLRDLSGGYPYNPATVALWLKEAVSEGAASESAKPAKRHQGTGTPHQEYASSPSDPAENAPAWHHDAVPAQNSEGASGDEAPVTLGGIKSTNLNKHGFTPLIRKKQEN